MYSYELSDPSKQPPQCTPGSVCVCGGGGVCVWGGVGVEGEVCVWEGSGCGGGGVCVWGEWVWRGRWVGGHAIIISVNTIG